MKNTIHATSLPSCPSTSLVGLILRRLRQLHGVSQQDLAQRAQTDPSYLSHIERGNGKVSVNKIQQVCDALELTDDKLLFLCRQFDQSAHLRFLSDSEWQEEF